MRAPPEAMKPTTGAPGAPGQLEGAHDRVGVHRPERAAEPAPVLGVGDDRTAGTRPAARPRRRRRAPGHRAPPRRRRSGWARTSRDRTGPRAAPPAWARGPTRERGRRCSPVVDPAKASTTLWPPKPNELDRATGGPPLRGLQRPRLARHVVEVELGVGLAVAERRRDDAVAQREHGGDGLDRAAGAEQVPDGRLRRRDRDLAGVVAERALIASVSAASLSGVEVPWALT